MTTQSIPIKSGQVKPRLHGLKALFTPQAFRRLVQSVFAFFILYGTIVHVAAGESASKVTASPEAYCPFGGLDTPSSTALKDLESDAFNVTGLRKCLDAYKAPSP